MNRVPSPFASPYPTDPSWGMIGSSLATALFGDPEMAAKAKLQRAQTEQAAASAGYDRARTTQTEDVTAARRGWATNPQIRSDLAAVMMGNPEDVTLEQYAKGNAGMEFLDAARRGIPGPSVAQPTGLAGAVTGMIGNPTEETDDEITVTAPTPVRAALQPKGPLISEDVARLLGAVLGMEPDDRTAYTTAQGDAYQGRELRSEEERNRYTADSRLTGDRYQADRSAGASMYNARLDYDAAVRGQNITDSRERGLGSFGKGSPNKPKFVPPTQMDDVDNEILRQFNGGVDDEGKPIQNISDGAMTNVRRKAIEFYQQNGNMAESVAMSLRYWRNIGQRERQSQGGGVESLRPTSFDRQVSGTRVSPLPNASVWDKLVRQAYGYKTNIDLLAYGLEQGARKVAGNHVVEEYLKNERVRPSEEALKMDMERLGYSINENLTKTLDGKNYVKIDGQWYEQNP